MFNNSGVPIAISNTHGFNFMLLKNITALKISMDISRIVCLNCFLLSNSKTVNIKLNMTSDLSEFSISNLRSSGESLGSGATGSVELMMDEDERKYAVKKMNIFSQRDQESFFSEAKKMTQLNHPCVIKMFKFQIPDSNGVGAIVMEYADHGSLRDLIDNPDEELSTTQKATILWEIARGMKYIHKNGIIHRDLKPENILLKGRHRDAKVSDFGLARERDQTMTQDVGTPSYMAPEQINSKDQTSKVDVFAFGQLAVEVLSGERLFPKSMNKQAIISKICSDNLPPIPESIEGEWREMIVHCRAHDPNERPSFKEIEQFTRELADRKTVKRVYIQEKIMKYKDDWMKAIEKLFKAKEEIKRLNNELKSVQRNNDENIEEKVVHREEEATQNIEKKKKKRSKGNHSGSICKRWNHLSKIIKTEVMKQKRASDISVQKWNRLLTSNEDYNSAGKELLKKVSSDNTNEKEVIELIERGAGLDIMDADAMVINFKVYA